MRNVDWDHICSDLVVVVVEGDGDGGGGGRKKEALKSSQVWGSTESWDSVCV